MRVRIIHRLSEVPHDAWDALVGEDDPFVEHAFLDTLERSGSVGGESGWKPTHVTAWDGDRLVGAMPLYLKEHSYGEYIFDWGWADAAYRAGIEYYPKLVCMVPLTPATGTRLLVHPDARRNEVVPALLEATLGLAAEVEASSVHLLFLEKSELEEVKAFGRFLPRLTMQYHWHNDGYRTFDDFLGRFRAPSRKNVKKERRVVAESGLDVRVVSGAELTQRDWEMVRRFYRDTCGRKGSFPYLTNAFFDMAAESLRERAVVVMAKHGEDTVAATLNFEKGKHLYGRYWGCSEDYQMLHFELCYYQLIARAIARGMTRFEAGAQGSHKLQRGLMPAPVHSAHWLRHEGLRRGVAEFLAAEAFSTTRHMAELSARGPFRRESP